MTENETKVISKMSVKNIGCNPKVASAKDKSDTTAVVLCRIRGIASGIKMGEDAKGTVWSALTGQFRATNLQEEPNGVYESGRLFLPSGIHDMVENAVKAAGENPNIAFSLEIRAVRADNPIGYSYQAVPLVRAAEHDPLAQLEAQEVEATKRLQAPQAPQENTSPTAHKKAAR